MTIASKLENYLQQRKNQDEVFFEAGDHQSLVRMSGVQIHELMAPAERGEFSHPHLTGDC